MTVKERGRGDSKRKRPAWQKREKMPCCNRKGKFADPWTFSYENEG